MNNPKKRFQVCLLVALGMIAFFASSCEKEVTTIKKDPIITWSNPADITVGTALSATQLNATANVNGNFVYTPVIDRILPFGPNQDLKVVFSPADEVTYNEVSKTVKINVVQKKDPILSWSNPADIIEGTKLSARQLNANSDVPGYFNYAPAPRSLLAAGENQELKATFHPTDEVTYNTASISVKINVNPFIIETVNIPAGTFIMGSPLFEPNRRDTETQFTVTLSAFQMGKYEITNAQFAVFLNVKEVSHNAKYLGDILLYESDSGLYFDYNYWQWMPVLGYENHPAIKVTWHGASEFATYVGGTLPTEAQWEYACRAGTTTPFNVGDCLTNLQANYDWEMAYSYNSCTNTVTTRLGVTQKVGSYPANAWGLHDMHGNVAEWCSDWYGPYPTSPQSNPTGAEHFSYLGRVSRGGDWRSAPQYCRSASRHSRVPDSITNITGFRVVIAN